MQDDKINGPGDAQIAVRLKVLEVDHGLRVG